MTDLAKQTGDHEVGGTPASAFAPLAGVRVLEFTHTIMGPACGMTLADLGADVVKIEPAPEGDRTRRLAGFGAGFFGFFNRNKRSVAVDLKHPDGNDIALRLIRQADVLVENFAPGTMERLGLGYEDVRKINPRLIYCALKGFLSGPYENRLALDEVVQMMGGLAYMTGPTGQPLRAGASIIDIMGATYGVIGILTALRERERTGHGQKVKSALFETTAFLMGQHLAVAAITGRQVPPMPERQSSWAVYDVFDADSGGQIFLGIISDPQWKRFCETFGRVDWGSDPELATNQQRIAARSRLIPEIATIFSTMSADEAIARCEAAGLPVAPVARPEDLWSDPHLEAVDGLVDTVLPDGTHARLPRLPLEIDGVSSRLYRNPPHTGQHSREILTEAGITNEAIDALAVAGVIVADDEAATANPGNAESASNGPVPDSAGKGTASVR